jgi:L-ascorbate metabolism protein UlaG (beta-lactamase superfamily)
MEIEYFGGNAIKLKVGSVSIGFDLNLPGSVKPVGESKELRAVYYTDSVKNKSARAEGVMQFEMPGEYEIGPFSVMGVSTKAYGDVYGTERSNVFLIDPAEFGLVGVIGYGGSTLSEEALDLLANARLVFVPVGGMGLGMEPEEAMKLVKSLNAEFVVPVHYDDGKTKYESPQASVEEFIKLTGSVEPERYEAKLNTKNLTASTDGFKVVVIKP